jgi:hypothetical protein
MIEETIYTFYTVFTFYNQNVRVIVMRGLRLLKTSRMVSGLGERSAAFSTPAFVV